MFAEDSSGLPVNDPIWSPDGRRLLYTRDEALWLLDVTPGAVPQAPGTPSEPLLRLAPDL